MKPRPHRDYEGPPQAAGFEPAAPGSLLEWLTLLGKAALLLLAVFVLLEARGLWELYRNMPPN